MLRVSRWSHARIRGPAIRQPPCYRPATIPRAGLQYLAVANEISNRNVFILGAGFSRDAGAPLIHDFLDVSREFFDDPNSGLDEWERSQFRAVFEFKKQIAQAREKVRIDLDNIEQLFGMVEMSHRLGSISADTRDATVYLIAKTLQLAATQRNRGWIRFGLNREFPASSIPFAQFVEPEAGGDRVYGVDMYRHFALLLAGKYDDPRKAEARSNTVITFNYDLVLDSALRAVGVPPLYGLSDSKAEEPETPDDSTSGVPVLKLHGSTNWAICDECKKVKVLEGKVTESPAAFRTGRCHSCQRGKMRLLLVPPSWDKSEHSKPMRPVWRKAVDALKTATRICVIGYSMPETDAFFKFLLTLGLAENHHLYRFILVDKVRQDPLAELSPPEAKRADDVDVRYREMLEDIFVERRFTFIPDGLFGFLRGGACKDLGRGELIAQM
jgi:NAD-dependent SIR2 family protein deacetylase